MQILADFLTWAENYFITHELTFGHGTDNAWDEAVAIALYVLKLQPTVTDAVLTRKLDEQEKLALISLAETRVQERIPVPYLTKEAWFAKEKYYVDQRAIIPRSPFAELISTKMQPWLQNRQLKTALDLCTGSGCMAIALAKHFPDLLVTAVDLSADALAVANYNVLAHHLKTRIVTLQSDLFQNLSGQQFDLIISNPPYIALREHYYLPEEYQYEPKLALVSGADGLDCTRLILQNAHDFLTADGVLFVEVGNNWKLLAGYYSHIPFTWISLAHGGEGIFMLTKTQLEIVRDDFNFRN